MSLDQRARTASEDLLRVSDRQVDTETWLRDLPWLRRRRDLTRIVATSAVVALVVGGGWFARSQFAASDQPVAPTGPTEVAPEDPAESFMRAWASGDAEGVMDMLTPGGRVDGYEAAQVPALLDWSRAVGQQYQLYQCDLTSFSDAECNSSVEDALTRLFVPYAGPGSDLRTAVLSLDGDRIADATDVVRLPDDGLWQPFMTWLRHSHPADADVMLDSDERPRLTPTSIRLWMFAIEEFVRSDGVLVRAHQLRINEICATAMAASGRNPSAPLPRSAIVVWAGLLQGAVAQMRAMPAINLYQPMFEQLDSLLEQRAAEIGQPPDLQGDGDIGAEIWTLAPWLHPSCDYYFAQGPG